MKFGRKKCSRLQRLVILAVGLSPLTLSADQSADLAKQLANPIALLISVPIEFDLASGQADQAAYADNAVRKPATNNHNTGYRYLAKW